MTKAKKIIVAVMILFFGTIPSVVRAGSNDFFGQDFQTTKEAILKKIPVGTKISIARSLMEDNGFRCVFEKNKTFTEDGPSGASKIYHNKVDFLWCDSGEKPVSAVVTKRWQAAIVFKSDAVTDVFVSVGLTGL